MPKLSIRPSFSEGEMVFFVKIKWLYLCNNTNLLRAFFFLTAKVRVGQEEIVEGSAHHLYKAMMCIYKDSNDTLLGHIQWSALHCAWRENASLTLKWPLWLMLTAVLMSWEGVPHPDWVIGKEGKGIHLGTTPQLLPFNSQNQFLLFQGHIYKQRLSTVYVLPSSDTRRMLLQMSY